MEQRWRFVLHQTRPATVPPDALIRLQFGRDNGWGRRVIGLPNGVTSRPRCAACSAMPDPWTAATCRCPNHLQIQAWTMTSLPAVPTRALHALTDAHRVLNGLLPTPPSDELTAGSTMPAAPRLVLANFGIPSAVPLDIGGTGTGRAIGAPGQCTVGPPRPNGALDRGELIIRLCGVNATAEERAIMTRRVSASSLARTWRSGDRDQRGN